MAAQAEKGADAVSGVVHGRKSGPVAGPTVHVLLMGGFEELELAEFAIIVKLFHEEELAGVDDGFHHHVFQARGGAEIDDCFTVLDGGRHGDGAGDVLASLEGGDGLLGVIGNGGVDVDGVDRGISEDVFEIGVALFDAIFIADLVERGFGALTNGHEIGVRMALVNGDEFGTEAEADDCDVW